MTLVEFDGMDGSLVAPPRRFKQGPPHYDIELHARAKGHKRELAIYQYLKVVNKTIFPLHMSEKSAIFLT